MVIHKASLIILLTSLISIFSQLGIIYNINPFKYLSVSFFIIVYIISIHQIIIDRRLINWIYILPILFILYLYPMFNITLDVLKNFNFKTFSDGFIIQGGYYHLIIFALAFITYFERVDFYKILKKYILLMFPVAFILIILSFSADIDSALNIGFLSINNILIPASLLVFFNKNNLDFIIGWISILIILFLSSYLGSRSYTLVGFFLFLFAAIKLYKEDKGTLLKLIMISILIYIIGGFSFFQSTSELREENILDRFQFDSLLLTLEKFMNTFDFSILFYWEGNSRATILEHAFSNFSTSNWLFGKGIFATYNSFIVRSTIELNWAQEIFRWGIIYTISLFIIMLIARNKLNKLHLLLTYNYNFLFLKIISILVLIKIIDSFIYGMPTTSVYNLIVYLAIVSLGLKYFKGEVHDQKTY